MGKLVLIMAFVFGINLIAEGKRGQTYFATHPVKNEKLDPNHARFILDFNSLKHEMGISKSRQIEFSCNGVIRKVELDTSFTVEVITSPGEYEFKFYAGGRYDEIITDSIPISGGYDRTIITAFQYAVKDQLYEKPVIYTYSETEQEVNIELIPNGNFTFTYPAYNDGWNGIANPDGSFTTNGKTYPYLFWEGENSGKSIPTDYSNGYIINSGEVTTFLEEKLTQMGLNQKEQTDFITFWAPRMMQSNRGFVKFLFNEDYDQIATLNVNPKPDHIFRVYLLWTPLDRQEVVPEPQQIPTVHRDGFYLLEWGGSELPFVLND